MMILYTYSRSNNVNNFLHFFHWTKDGLHLLNWQASTVDTFPQIHGSGLYLTNNKLYVCSELFALGMMNYIFLFPLTINICIPQLSLPCMFLNIG